jgi:hypothetical protein
LPGYLVLSRSTEKQLPAALFYTSEYSNKEIELQVDGWRGKHAYLIWTGI